MANSYIETLLSLDEYARIMAIPSWHFNQCVSSVERLGAVGVCNEVWVQSGYMDPSRITGRDEVADAIAVAEEQIAAYLGFWPAPRFVCNDEVDYPIPERGQQIRLPILKTKWGYVHTGGVLGYVRLLQDESVTYTDANNDEELDTATVSFGPVDADLCEVVIVPPGYDPRIRDWRIRPLTTTIDNAGVITMTGPRGMFINPERWLTTEETSLDSVDPTHFLQTVDVYRRYIDTSIQAQYVWNNAGLQAGLCDTDETTICIETCQDACISVGDKRVGLVYASPGTFVYLDDAWYSSALIRSDYPAKVRLNYVAGYDGYSCSGCDLMSRRIKQAIVRLANVLMTEAPCGCGHTRERWDSDRQEMAMTEAGVRLAQATFGTTARGAVFTLSVLNTLPKLGQGG
jgi:NAD-dependent dihydropyrimidine dehydrogenase PreA subunit